MRIAVDCELKEQAPAETEKVKSTSWMIVRSAPSQQVGKIHHSKTMTQAGIEPAATCVPCKTGVITTTPLSR